MTGQAAEELRELGTFGYADQQIPQDELDAAFRAPLSQR